MITFHLIPHTHWDREWYLPEAAFRTRLVTAIGELLDLLEREPDARFVLDGQTVLLDDVLEIEPAWRQRVVNAVSRRQLAVGPWFILADELIPSGEALVRNLLRGQRDTTALGSRMQVMYSPDAFGHPDTLVMLAHEFGIERAALWRGLGSASDDHDFYRWRDRGNRELLVYHFPRQGYEVGASLATAGHALPSRWAAIRDALVARSTTAHVAVFVGADHHAPPRNPSGLRDAVAALEPGNQVRLSTLDEFFDAAVTPPGFTAVGPLRSSPGYTWSLQGVAATRSRLKRRYTLAESTLLRVAEPLCAWCWSQGVDIGGMIRHLTRQLVESQFHDTLCGCSSDLVAREQEVRLATLHQAAREVINTAIARITRHDADLVRDSDSGEPAVILFNPAARSRSCIITATITRFRRDVLIGPPGQRSARVAHPVANEALTLTDPAGNSIPVQVLSVVHAMERQDAPHHYPDQDEVERVRIAFPAPAVRGLGITALRLQPVSASVGDSTVAARHNLLRNRFLECHISPSGQIDLIDRRSGEHFANLLRLFDEVDMGDTYTPYVPPDAPLQQRLRRVERRVLANGPWLASVAYSFVLAAGNRGTVTGRVVLMLHADSALLRVRVECDNQAIDHRLRCAINTGTHGNAIAGTGYGATSRGEQRGAAHPLEQELATTSGQRYVAVGDAERGIAVFTPGLVEYEWSGNGAVTLTLFRSVGELSRGSLPPRPGHAGWPAATPGAQEPGRHVCEFGVLPCAESERDSTTWLEQQWEDVFLPVQPTFIRQFNGEMISEIGLELEGEGLIHTACKIAESGKMVVVRCFNPTGSILPGRWRSARPLARATLLRADESTLGCLDLFDDHTATFTAPAFGLVTLGLSFR